MKPQPKPEPNAAAAHSAPDQALAQRVRAEITRVCSGAFPAGVTMRVVERRVELGGCVENLDFLQRIEKAAAASAGLLGVHNQLRIRPPEPAPPPAKVADPCLGVPLERDAGQVNHKV